ncbi:peptigoglycan-binding protein LysM [Pseudomonas oryzihabitans]|nr:peptigoglycan-binding protein LysM [Pseudomonas psychrotolerans]KTT36396.1 peptigoglycan-binding protein LysM [Pseudomonas psychrotolerans]KTT77426.1 peptigoglycan-binding protein LysM [Pseudomonas psychrotolerans]
MKARAQGFPGRGRAVWLAGLLVALLLTGCSTSGSRAPVVERSDSRGGVPQVTSGQYRVKRGDTLFSIASRNGWEWRALAAQNGLSAPYVIHVGQVIRFGSGSTATASGSSRIIRRPATGSPAAVATGPAAGHPVATPVPTSPPVTSNPSAATPVVTANLPEAPPPTPVTPAQTPTRDVPQSAAGWAWPTKGTLISRFSASSTLNKGIDIAGQEGQPVMAAADGTVVYAGNGLRGYGELVIIKHSETYVSAYGHNRRLLVREGERVKIGQTIAEMGSTGTDRVKLHFEIRRQGKPVDPLQFLPNR